MQLKCRKMNNITVDDLPQRVGDMHSILLGISLELANIKKLMKTEKDAKDRDGDTDSQKSLKEEDGNLITSYPDTRMQGAPPLTIMRNNIYEAEPQENLSGNSYDGMKNYQPVFRERESFSSLSGHLPAKFNSARTPTSITNKASFQTQSEKRPLPEYHKSASMFSQFNDDEEHLESGPLRPPSPFLIIANKVMKGPVILNIGGKKHEVRWDTLDKFPTSRLGRLRHCVTHRGLKDLCDAYSLQKREYYFDRSPRNFDSILGLYRTNKLHLSQGVCVQDFCEELEYWGLTDLHLEPCCQHTYYRARWLLPQHGGPEDADEDFGNGIFAPSQKHLWNLFENPHHSCAAKVVAVVSCMFVVVSTLCLIFSTLPRFQQKDEKGIVQEEYFFEVAEAVFVGWFTFEYVIRFIAAPRKLEFTKAGMNIVDLLGILPYFASLCLSLVMTATASGQTKYQDEMRRIAQIFRILRILRIFKLARHITGLQTLGMTLKNSYKELGLLMLVVIMGMLIFSGLAYVGEKDEPDTMFISMPQALYWAIITMTSVGYGDIAPTTWFGKLVGSACAICGVLCISLPIPIIVNNFNKFYEKAKIEEEIMAKKKKSSWEEAKRGVFQNIHDSFDEIDSKSLYPFYQNNQRETNASSNGEFWEKASPGPGKSLSDCCIPDMSSPNTIPTICNGSISETRTQDFDLVDIGIPSDRINNDHVKRRF